MKRFTLTTIIFGTLLVSGTMLLFQGCANYQIRTASSDPLDNQYQSSMMHAFAWGALVSPEILEAKCEGESINDVVIESNYLYDFASVVTLGLWMPIEVSYRCNAGDLVD